MYLTINGERYTVRRRFVSETSVKYLDVTPEPGAIQGTIQMYQDNGFLISEDDAGDYQRQEYVGNVLKMTNEPVPAPEPEPVPAPDVWDELDAAYQEGVNGI